MDSSRKIHLKGMTMVAWRMGLGRLHFLPLHAFLYVTLFKNNNNLVQKVYIEPEALRGR